MFTSCNLSQKIASMKILEIVNKESSKWIKEQETGQRSFHWQDGSGFFSVSPSHFEAVRQYILLQEERRQKVSYREEFLRIPRNTGWSTTRDTFGIEA